MPIDLPAGSLGPKPTKKQMELLKRMATSGAKVHTYVGIRDAGGAYINYPAENAVQHETISRKDVNKFYDWGWIEITKSEWNGSDYVVSERGKKVIAKGVTR